MISLAQAAGAGNTLKEVQRITSKELTEPKMNWRELLAPDPVTLLETIIHLAFPT